jgi:hypothetical protein
MEQSSGCYLFFKDTLLDIYKDLSGLYAFTCYRTREQGLPVFNGRPLYPSKQVALREAKKYCILSKVATDTKNIKIVCDFSTDIVLAPSKLAQKIFGKINGYKAEQLYCDSQDRIKLRRFLEHQNFMTYVRSRFQSLDGTPIEASLTGELIELDEQTKLIIESFLPLPTPSSEKE